jgi:hypothetical protein
MRKLAHSLIVIAVLGLVGFPSTSSAQTCPCNIWSPSTTPGTVDGGDTTPGELGVRFNSTVAGYITGIRFYKSAANTGTHAGHLWNNTGTLLASVTFTNETSSGWQEATFGSPVAITAGTTYVASYFTPTGHFSYDAAYFTNTVSNPPLQALADGVDGANGSFTLSPTSSFPASTFNSSNYWVDVVFNTSIPPNPPTVTSLSPPDGSVGISALTPITATFNQALDPSTVNSTTFQLLDPNNNVVAATVSYDNATFTATLTPTAPLSLSTTYTAILRGGTADPRIKNEIGRAHV